MGNKVFDCFLHFRLDGGECFSGEVVDVLHHFIDIDSFISQMVHYGQQSPAAIVHKLQ